MTATRDYFEDHNIEDGTRRYPTDAYHYTHCITTTQNNIDLDDGQTLTVLLRDGGTLSDMAVTEDEPVASDTVELTTILSTSPFLRSACGGFSSSVVERSVLESVVVREYGRERPFEASPTDSLFSSWMLEALPSYDVLGSLHNLDLSSYEF